MIKPLYYIESYCRIKNGKVHINGEPVFNGNFENFPEFIKAVYKIFKSDYPKFFKMDNLSKLAFMATDLILKGEDINYSHNRNIALVFSNRAGSIDTDRKHQEYINDEENGHASPAVFVYTLPNICMGEISIRHKLFSENSFFIFNHFNAPHLYNYTSSILDAHKAAKVLSGWIDFDGKEYEAFVYLVSGNGNMEHSIDQIKRLYNA